MQGHSNIAFTSCQDISIYPIATALASLENPTMAEEGLKGGRWGQMVSMLPSALRNTGSFSYYLQEELRQRMERMRVPISRKTTARSGI